MMSKDLERFIQNRCFDILENDARYKELNKIILEKEKEFKSTLDEEQLKKYNSLESYIIQSVIQAQISTFKSLINSLGYTTLTPL